MIMWLRLGGALLVTLAALGCLDYFGVWSILGGRSGEDAPETAHRTRELFWLMIFWVVMATALLAAARRWTSYLRIGRRAY
jgi:F0F1-type ATP synthase membrane subunit c/vacuolar-type H+-ATPase subunit K